MMGRKRKQVVDEFNSAISQIEAEQKIWAAAQERKRKRIAEGKPILSEADKMLEAITLIGDYLANFPTPKRAAAR